VPRPETECLVQQALELVPGDACSVVDLGTGSGAIALSLATERPQWNITGVDLSAQALAVAARNATALNLPQVAWRLGSWLDAVPGERFDLIVANPPYIAGSDPALLTLKAEPAMALTCGRGIRFAAAARFRRRAHLSGFLRQAPHHAGPSLTTLGTL
jgi:release factor glutamine methyltransferase